MGKPRESEKDTLEKVDLFNSFMVKEGGYIREKGQVIMNPATSAWEFTLLLERFKKTHSGKQPKK